MKVAMKNECVCWHQRGNLASCPPLCKLAVQENNPILAILPLGPRRIQQLEEGELFAEAQVALAGPEDSHELP